MKLSLAGSLVVLAAGMTAVALSAQITTYTPPDQEPVSAPAATPAQADQPKPPGGKVILSRSTDENRQTTTQAGPAAAPPPIKMADAPTAEDAERQSVTFTDFDMDVRLRPSEQHIAVRALVTVRNDGNKPLAHIPLQVSSSLNWERIRINARDVMFPVAILNSDADHAGQLHEAAVPLAQPLAPGATVQLDVTYSGRIAPNAQRLIAIGTPDDVALHSDWDQIGVDFTGLRGFGNVVWYPVSSVPVILGDGARLFDEIGEHKLRMAGARFRLRLTVEFPHGRAPSVALINGHLAPLSVTNPEDLNQEVSGVATADNGGETLGFEAPSLFAAIRTPKSAVNTMLWVLPDDESAVSSWSDAASTVTPFLQGWLGQRPRSQLTLLDLPDAQDAPYETGSMLATAIRTAAPEQLDGVMAHALTHAWMESPRAWLSEGVAHFMGTLWIEKQRGREQALGTLETSRSALALAEPESPGQSVGQPLAHAISPVYYRTKATYVFWMLREVAGDATLSAALRAYDPAADTSLGYGRDKGPSPFEKLLEQAGNRRDLSWFFADWVNADKGLPDLAISSVYPSPEQAGNWLVTVNVANNGFAAAEVPVTVRSDTNSVTQRVLVPARGKAAPHLLILGKPTEVQVNDGTIPETAATVHITKLDQSAGTGTAQPNAAQP
ncbi:MAG TPA: hypothetical protein VN776_07855 [Terracidiphilus sp.]|nr:hypothetical protein [Terracidiphilus sp.]